MLNDSIEPTPRSMRTSGIWSKEGKTKGGKATHWSFLSKKERMSMPKHWVSKKELESKYARNKPEIPDCYCRKTNQNG